MGGLTSKSVDEAVVGTPHNKSSHFLANDPRSPSDYITRTPISVTDTPEKSNGSTSQDTPTTKVLLFDPRSPTSEVVRTPIAVESKHRRRPFSLRPSRLAEPESISSSDPDHDPRSPTTKVPRTPLQDKTHTFTNKDEEMVSGGKEAPGVEGKKDEEEGGDNQEATTTRGSDTAKGKEAAAETSKDKVRRPLTGMQTKANGENNTPLGLLQAKQCRTIEEEYTKNQQVIFSQLSEPEQENRSTVVSNTQFVESI